MKFRAIAIALGISLVVLAGIYGVLIQVRVPQQTKAADSLPGVNTAPQQRNVPENRLDTQDSPSRSELSNKTLRNFDDSTMFSGGRTTRPRGSTDENHGDTKPQLYLPHVQPTAPTAAAAPQPTTPQGREAIQVIKPRQRPESAPNDATEEPPPLAFANPPGSEEASNEGEAPKKRKFEDTVTETGSSTKRKDLKLQPPIVILSQERLENRATRLGADVPNERTKAAIAEKVPPEPESGLLIKNYGTNPTIDVAAEPISTFAADVDTGSYTMARGYLERNQMPPEAAVRVEEVVNAFNYHYRPPEKDAFAIQVEAFPSPYRKGYHLLHIGLKGREVQAAQRKSANLVFVIDVSGSMEAENRLPMAKRALHLLTDQLREDDCVSIVVYGTTAHTVLEPTWAVNKTAIHEALDRLQSEGSTNVQAGLELGYTMAFKRFKPGAINRVILLSDGVANNGITNADGIFAKVKSKASEGVTLTTVGFGMGSYNDVLMERLADQGDGHYAYVDKIDEARRLFVEQLTGTLEVIAKDVKLQVEFNPEAVTRYRLLGFENRALNKEDFANDRIDAGELGAGHSVTAIYEVKLKSRNPKYFATFRARFKQPRGGASALIEKSLPIEIIRDSASAASAPTRLSLVAAGFAEKLRGSYWARNLSWNQLLNEWDALPSGLKAQAQPQELRQLMVTAQRLDRRGDPWERELPIARMDFDRIPVLR